MSDQDWREVSDELHRDRAQLRQALDETLSEEVGEAWLPNAAAWIAVVGGAFIINLLVLLLVTGG